MSAPSKRHATDCTEVILPKQTKQTVQNDQLEIFLSWAHAKNFDLNKKVTVGRDGSCAQYGMVAVDDIKKDEVLFQIPRDVLLHPGTTAIKGLLVESCSELESKSEWVPLLVSLMYEYNNPKSLWRPYLDLVPDFNELDLPMFWPSSERDDLLKGTSVPEAVSKDLQNIESEFTDIVLPFVQKHTDTFSNVCQDLQFYKKMVAFIMAYSFTEPIKNANGVQDKSDQVPVDSDDDEEQAEILSPPMMVPMADILNHVANNNAQLTFEKDSLKMVATKEIKKGKEVFNTYGELSNGHLLHMYGFSEPYPNNHFDEVTIHGKTVMEAAKDLECNPEEIFSQKKLVLQAMGLIDTTFIAGVEGILTEDEMIQALKIWTMPSDLLESYMESDGWIDDEDEEESLLYENGIEKLSKEAKSLLSRCAQKSLNQYKTTLEEDEDALKKDTVNSRQRYSLYVNIGQKQILKKIIDSCG